MQKLCCVRTRQHPLPVWSHKFDLSSLTHFSTNSHPFLVGIVSNLFRSPRDVEGWESGFEVFPHRVPSGSNSPLTGFVKGLLNGVFVDPSKIWPEPLKVNVLRGESMFMLSKVEDECMLNSPLKIAKFINPGVMGT